MRRPLIGLTAAVRQDAPGIMRAATKDSYIRAVCDAGGLPVIIAPAPLDCHAPGQAADVLHDILARLDGLLLPGGVDVAPAHYAELPHPQLGTVDAERDALELALCRWSLAEDKPLLGICRGIQVMNVAAGGTLYQDIPTQYETKIVHSTDGHPRDFIAHDVLIDAGACLAGMVGAGPLPTNSWHHQALKAVAPLFIVSARAPDGIVEAIEAPSRRFALGVQFHPEDLYAGSERIGRLFAAFIAACSDDRQA